jgi:hypothetical protein
VLASINDALSSECDDISRTRESLRFSVARRRGIR